MCAGLYGHPVQLLLTQSTSCHISTMRTSRRTKAYSTFLVRC